MTFICFPFKFDFAKILQLNSILDKLENVVDKSSIVTDVSSLKRFVCVKKRSYVFIPSHPMAGTEHSGWDYSFPDMFEGATWAVTPGAETSNRDLNLLKSVIEEFGAKIIITTPEEHDLAVALISHAPMLIAQALCKNIESNKLAQSLASSGFRDTTRLALSNIEMANDMITMNKANIKKAVELLNLNIEKLFDGDYKKEAEGIKTLRTNLYL